MRVPSGSASHRVHDLLRRLLLHLAPAVGAVRRADARIEQAQIVIDLGDRAHRRARVVRSAALVNRDGRRKPLDLIHVRLFHLAQELPRIGRQAFDVAALAFGKDRVERQRRLAGAGQAR